MTVSISVRRAAPRDLKAIIAMCDALNAHSGLPTGRLDAKSFRAALFGKNAFLFADIAEAVDADDARASVAGYTLAHDAFTTDFGERGMYLVDLFVEPAWRRAGVGRALMAAAAARTKARGGTHLWWASMPGNFLARRFYGALRATDEKLHSHALFGRPFDLLAARGSIGTRRSRPE
ncbi:MAG: GNAT family N-acetyltransferase [Amphiplicatus sp.]